MTILYLHGMYATPGGTKPTFLRQHGHEVIEPLLPPYRFDESVAIAQKAFESAVVSKQLTSALKKVEARAARRLPADSAEQWIERNCPELGRR